MTLLAGKTAIVTGAARGIGREAARLLAEHGAEVLIVDLDETEARAAADGIDGAVAHFAADLTQPGLPEQAIAAAVERFGKLDILVNNAGYTWDGVVHKMPDEQFQAMLDIHTIAPFRLIRAAAPHLREPGKRERAEGVEEFRKIVNVASISGTMGNAGQGNYAAAKGAIVGLTKTLAKEWAAFKVNVNAVAFGFVETRLTAPKEDGVTFVKDDREIALGIPSAIRERAAASIPLGRPATPAEAAGGIFMLCTPWSNFVHGQVLNVTGGQIDGMTS